MHGSSFIKSKENGGAIINVNNEALDAYKRQRQLLNDKKNNDERLNKLEDSIQELKEIVLKLANGK